MRIETERLILKKVEDTDIEELFKIFNDKDVTKYFVTSDKNIVDTKMRIENIKAHWYKYNFGDFILINKETFEIAGFGGLHYKMEHGNVNISYIINKNLWGSSLGYETCLALLYYGFNILELNKIVAEIDSENKNSINLIEKCAFTFNKIIEWKGFNRLEYIMQELDFNKLDKALFCNIKIQM